MWNFLIIVFLLLLVVSFFSIGRKLINYQSTDNSKKEEDIFEELKNIGSIKIDIVPYTKFYRNYFGGILLFIAYYIGVCLIGSLIGNSSIGQGGIESVIFFPFYIAIFSMYFWYYPFLKHGIVPNLKYGQTILKRLHKLFFAVSILVILPIWISASVHIMHVDENLKIGTMIPGFFISFFIFLFVPRLIINFELRRLGIPNLWIGIKGLMKDNIKS